MTVWRMLVWNSRLRLKNGSESVRMQRRKVSSGHCGDGNMGERVYRSNEGRGKQVNLTGIVYRPPYEANSLLLQVTLGCSHNQCTFCYMYPNVQFRICPMEQIETDIEEAAKYQPNVERVFLEHGDAFVLSADRLMKIADAIQRKLKKVKKIAMYASIQNIKHKTDAELRRLCDCGIGGLDIGVESGLDAALSYMNKGHTAEEAKEQLLRLTKAGIGYSFNAILGCGGAELWREKCRGDR